MAFDGEVRECLGPRRRKLAHMENDLGSPPLSLWGRTHDQGKAQGSTVNGQSMKRQSSAVKVGSNPLSLWATVHPVAGPPQTGPSQESGCRRDAILTWQEGLS